MPRANDLTGQVFGRLTVIRLSEKRGNKGQRYWDCKCSCGSTKTIWAGSLQNGDSKSCGCLHKEIAGANRKTHGLSKHPAYGSWHSMMNRCQNPKHPTYLRYGGRGIKVCKQWQTFDGFLKDMGSSHQLGLSIDRINNQQGYYPENCRWTTREEQNFNRGVSRIVNTPKGRMSVTQAAKEFGLVPKTVFERIKLGWPEDQLFIAPRDQTTCIMTPDGEMTVSEAAERYNIPPATIFSRIRYGWDEKDLLLPVRNNRVRR